MNAVPYMVLNLAARIPAVPKSSPEKIIFSAIFETSISRIALMRLFDFHDFFFFLRVLCIQVIWIMFSRGTLFHHLSVTATHSTDCSLTFLS